MKTCKNCNKPFSNYEKVNGKTVHLESRKFCLDCSPYGKHNTIQLHNLKDYGHVFTENNINYKICPRCKNQFEVNPTNFFIKKNGQPHPYCRKCHRLNGTERIRNIKIKCINYKGGKCQICGYSKYMGALDFHHLNPEEKDFIIGEHRNIPFDKLKIELDKCIILCSNCHREFHGNIINYPIVHKMTEIDYSI